MNIPADINRPSGSTQGSVYRSVGRTSPGEFVVLTNSDPHDKRPSMTARLTRSFAAVLILVGGLVHLDLWNNGYRTIPKIGVLFMANFMASAVLVAGVMASRRATVALAGIGFAAGSLGAFVLSRTVGIFGFTDVGWNAHATYTVASELGAIVLLATTLLLQRRIVLKAARRPAAALSPATVAAARW
jgi:hypothetical protein